jgi:CDP-diacylglycerol--glycerol-3-phosphate 3-phosphatidyltransferase
MPSIYDLKPAFQNRLRPICRGLAGMGVTANQVTLTALLISVAAGAAVVAFPARRWPLLLLPLVLFVRMGLNAIDGMMAREHAMQSRLGAVLNELGDVLADAALYLPLARVTGIPDMLVAWSVVLAVISEMTGVVAVQIGASRRYDGPMGKSDRAVVFGAVYLALGLGAPPSWWVTAVLTSTILLLGVTVVNRARRAVHEASR